jgi:hypothetical protein
MYPSKGFDGANSVLGPVEAFYKFAVHPPSASAGYIQGVILSAAEEPALRIPNTVVITRSPRRPRDLLF